ncbi:MAG: hypothetical protein ACXABM_14865 [Candidatus Thorarchaeota archaeon]|jgi:hypothetical protein
MQQTDIIPPGAPNPLLFMLMDTLLLITIMGATIYWLHTYKKPHRGYDVSRMLLTPTAITVVMIILAILGPIAINLYPYAGSAGIFYLIGMSWQITGLGFGGVMFSALFFLVALPFTFFRLVYVYMTYRYFRGHTAKKRAAIAGILGEIQLPLIGLAIIPIGLIDPMVAVVISIPVPILLIVGLALMQFIPIPQPIDGWKELDEQQDWWDHEQKVRSDS